MATVKELIKQLQEIENQDQPVIYNYYTADMLRDFTTDETVTIEKFAKIADAVDDCDNFWDDIWEGLMEISDEVDEA